MVHREDESGSINEELAKLKVVMWDKELENRKLREALRIATAKRQRYVDCVTEAESVQAALSTQLRNKQAQQQTLGRILESKQNRLVSLQQENVVLRSALFSCDSL